MRSSKNSAAPSSAGALIKSRSRTSRPSSLRTPAGQELPAPHHDKSREPGRAPPRKAAREPAGAARILHGAPKADKGSRFICSNPCSMSRRCKNISLSEREYRLPIDFLAAISKANFANPSFRQHQPQLPVELTSACGGLVAIRNRGPEKSGTGLFGPSVFIETRSLLIAFATLVATILK